MHCTYNTNIFQVSMSTGTIIEQKSHQKQKYKCYNVHNVWNMNSQFQFPSRNPLQL